MDCPSPGGHGCPMNVVRLTDGRLRAVCGCTPSVCDAIGLSREDLAILALDLPTLVGDLASALGAAPTVLGPAKRRVFELGRYAPAAGLSAPAILAIPGPRDPVSEEELRLAGLGPDRAIILVPRHGSFPPELRTRLIQAGHLLLALSEVTGLSPDGHLELLQSVELLLAPIRSELLARLKVTSRGPIFALPPGTKWGQVTLTLTSQETLVFATSVFSRQVDPGDLRMRSAKNNKPTLAWTLLTALASTNGVLVCREAAQETKVRKHKQELSKRLRDAFGLAGDPISWEGSQKAYVTRFVLRDQRSVAEKEALRGRRNFDG